MTAYAQKNTKDNTSEERKDGEEKDDNDMQKLEDFSDQEFESLSHVRSLLNKKRALSENPNNAMYLRKMDQDIAFHEEHKLSDCELDEDEIYQPPAGQIKDVEVPLDSMVYKEPGEQSQTEGTREETKGESREETKGEPQEEDKFRPKKKYKKTLFLTSDQLKKLNLRYGKNEITYSVEGFRGVQTNTSRIFFWNHKVKIVISDVDGTITRSDVLGHILPRLGRDWSHEGVTELFTNIRKNGYEFLYLTSRAIGMADSTRDYLNSLEQNENYRLPDGP